MFDAHIFCFSRSFSGVRLLTLKYVEAFYPLLLTLAVYFCISCNGYCASIAHMLHTIAVKIHCQNIFKKVKFSTSKAFVAFLHLACFKLLFVSLNLLIPNKVYKIEGDKMSHYWTLYFDPTVEYLGREHIPYFVSAILILLVFVISPMLLLILYPFKPFSRLLQLLLGSQWHSLTYFIDIFQGWFKNGADQKSRDYRLVSALFPLLKILSSVWITLLTGAIYRGHHVWLIPCLLFLSVGFFFAFFRPYKIEYMNYIDELY